MRCRSCCMRLRPPVDSVIRWLLRQLFVAFTFDRRAGRTEHPPGCDQSKLPGCSPLGRGRPDSYSAVTLSVASVATGVSQVYVLVMPDQQPPRLDGDERETLQTLVQYQRWSLVRKMAGVDEDAARRTYVGSGTTLLWLLKHMARAESLWILRRFAGEDVEIPDDTVNKDDTVEGAIDIYKSTWQRIDEVVAATPSLDEVSREVGDEAPVNLRWILMHLLEETARHAGHADVLRELIDGQTGR
jgi:uncharacterized damage-inducible protein DinB